jgi:large subunit ribosomal protein L24
MTKADLIDEVSKISNLTKKETETIVNTVASGNVGEPTVIAIDIEGHTAEDAPRKPVGVIEREGSIHVSNVAIYNPASQKGDRVGIKLLSDGRRVRVFRSNGEMIDA